MTKLFTSFFYVLIISCSTTYCFAQINFYQETCKCGVTGAGFSTGMGSGSGNFDIYIEPGSTIKKAYLFTIKFGNAADTTIKLNYIDFNPKEAVSSFYIFGGSTTPNITVNAIDITSSISPSLTNFSIDIPFQNSCVGCTYNCVYLYVLYENPLFTENITSYIFINDKNDNFNVDYQTSALNPISNSSPIGFANYLDRMGLFNPTTDGSYLYFQNGGIWNNVGLMKGSDGINSNWDYAGVKGHFYFQNNTLFGLDDDTPDNIVGGSDGLLDASQYLLPNNTLKWRLQWETNQPKYNIYNGFFITHTTPCQEFAVTTPNDTTLCQGSTLQLNATSTNPTAVYEWLPATGLSCNTCPNPIFTADSSMFYTVRVWNNDSCSVVRPLKINVRAKPTFGAITIVPSECGASTGSATFLASPNNGIVANWQELGGATQTTNVFQNLSAGNHTFFFVDTNGCQSADTVIFVNEVNNTIANFVADPLSGASPLTVNFTNTSQNATNYEWFVSSGSTTSSQGSNLQFFEFPSSGTYGIMLVAWQYDPSCADTAYTTILVYDSLMVNVPNVFTPNNDGINDYFSLTANQDADYELIIVNRWGETVFAENSKLIANTPKNCWNGTSSGSTTVTDGVYFVKLKVVTENGEEVKVEDFLTIVIN